MKPFLMSHARAVFLDRVIFFVPFRIAAMSRSISALLRGTRTVLTRSDYRVGRDVQPILDREEASEKPLGQPYNLLAPIPTG
jgi:hypothetical protein